MDIVTKPSIRMIMCSSATLIRWQSWDMAGRSEVSRPFHSWFTCRVIRLDVVGYNALPRECVCIGRLGHIMSFPLLTGDVFGEKNEGEME